MLQDQSRNRTPMPAAQQAADVARPEPGPARAEAGVAQMLACKSAPTTSPEMPTPGSPEAMAAFRAACTEFDRRTRLGDDEARCLRIGETMTLLTTETVRRAIDGDFSKAVSSNEAAAMARLSRAELQDLLVLTLQRDLQFEEAARDTRIHEMFALAYAGETDAPDASEDGADPILAAIAEHKAAYAEWLPHLQAVTDTPRTDPDFEAIEAAASAPEAREADAYEALSDTCPTTFAGLTALAGYLPGAVLRNATVAADNDALTALSAICSAVRVIARQTGEQPLAAEVCDDPTAAPIGDIPDPVHALIAEHQAAYAEWDRLSQVGNEMAPDAPGFAEAQAACTAPAKRESDLFEALLSARATTFGGTLALVEYLPSAIRQVDPNIGETDGERALRSVAASLRDLKDEGAEMALGVAVQARRALAEKFLLPMQRDGFVPYPSDKPRCLMAIKYAVRYEAERLLTIAQSEVDRQAAHYTGLQPAERDQHLAQMRAEFRLDELAAVARGREGDDHRHVVDRILTTWRDYGPCMVSPGSGIDDDEAERLYAAHSEALEQADKLPATIDNLLPKALAFAALECTEILWPLKSRDKYATNGRLAFDLHAAVTGRASVEA